MHVYVRDFLRYLARAGCTAIICLPAIVHARPIVASATVHRAEPGAGAKEAKGKRSGSRAVLPLADQATLAARNLTIAERAAGLGLVCAPEPLRAGHFLGLSFPDGVPDDLPARLGQAGVHVSLRGRSLRVTPHLWTDDADVDRLFKALDAAL